MRLKEWSPILINHVNTDFRLISNVTIIESLPISNWATGGELLITSSQTLATCVDQLKAMVDEMMKYSIPALVIKFKNAQEAEEFTSLVDYATQQQFPLFSIPKDKTYLSIISPIHDILSETKRRNLMKEDLFRLLLASQIEHQSYVYSYANSLHIDLKKYFTVLALDLRGFEQLSIYKTNIRNQMHLFFNIQMEKKYIEEYLLLENDEVLYYLVIGTQSQLKNNKISLSIHEFLNNTNIMIATSKVSNSSDIVLLFEQINFILDYGKQISKKSIIPYADIELLNIMHQSYDPHLKSMFQEVLNPLLEHPFLINTLICYFKQNENIKLTAQELYIHINTLQYRLHKIEFLTNLRLQYLPDKLRLYLVISAYIIYENKGGE